MLLAIDIGNSTTKLGVFEREKLITRLSIPTGRHQTGDQIDDSISENLNYPFDAVIISSVVPETNDAFEKFCEKRFQLTPVFVDNKLNFGLKILYNPPENLGIDRAVAAFAAREKYGAPVIVCDFGTATTIDLVNASGEFAGGIITPGIATLADSLFQKTSKLPRVEIKKPASVIGHSTVGSIQSGIYFGYVGLVKGILQEMFQTVGATPKVVATGGFAAMLAESVEEIEIVDENLMLEGLRRIYEEVSHE